jgi:hypothetical protein
MRIIEAASTGGVSAPLPDIALHPALTPVLFMRRLPAVKAVLSALDKLCRASGCNWSTIREAGFSAVEAKAAGCDLLSTKAVEFRLHWLIFAYSYDVVTSSGVDLSSYVYTEHVTFL